jgi:hypothetical protein
VGARFQVCFTPLKRVLFTFPSRYLCTIGRHLVFSLGGWAPRIQAGFHVSRPTRDAARPGGGFRLRGSHPVPPAFPGRSPGRARATPRSRNPRGRAPGFGLARFRSPLLARSLLISTPRGTEMFHFPRSRPARLCVQRAVPPCEGRRVAPFGHPRINARLQLPADFRSLPRPSSPGGAKASVVRPYTLGRKSRKKDSRPGSRLRCFSRLFPNCAVVKEQSRRSRKIKPWRSSDVRNWWACLESNQGPRPYQGRALTN